MKGLSGIPKDFSMSFGYRQGMLTKVRGWKLGVGSRNSDTGRQFFPSPGAT